MAETKAPVANPAFWSVSASVGTEAGSGGVTLSRKPCSAGSLPVSNDACDGRVSGT
jgi:hypothetical protein